METYKAVAGFECLYEVSDIGNVRSVPRKRMGNGSSYDVGYMILRGNMTRSGYRLVRLYHQNGRIRWTDASIHRLVAMAFVPNPSRKPHINHKDGNKKNNSASNLEWCTPSENMKHAIKTGLRTVLRGPNHGMAILSQAQVSEVRSLLSSGKLSQRKIGELYGVSRGCIRDIKTGKSWAIAA